GRLGQVSEDAEEYGSEDEPSDRRQARRDPDPGERRDPVEGRARSRAGGRERERDERRDPRSEIPAARGRLPQRGRQRAEPERDVRGDVERAAPRLARADAAGRGEGRPELVDGHADDDRGEPARRSLEGAGREA